MSTYAKFGSIHVRNQSTHRGASGRETYSRAFRITLMLFYMQRLEINYILMRTRMTECQDIFVLANLIVIIRGWNRFLS